MGVAAGEQLSSEALQRVKRLQLHSAAIVRNDGPDLRVDAPFAGLVLRHPGPGISSALHAMQTAPQSIDALAEIVISHDGPERLGVLFFQLDALERHGLLRHVVLAGEQPMMAIEANAPEFALRTVDLAALAPLRLSRFTLVRREGEALVAENPKGRARLTLLDRSALAIVHRLALPLPREELAALDDEMIACLHLLANAGLLDRESADDLPEDEDPVVRQWAFHDLLFHARSRFGRHNGPFGATFRHADTIEPLPAVRTRPAGAVIPLPRPDLAALRVSDPPLQNVIENRCSTYEYGAKPVTIAQLGELLFRTARVRTAGAMPVPGSDATMQISSRPYPSGGKGYELEFYLTVGSCSGLERGLYHYDPLDHALTHIDSDPAQVAALLDYCALAAPDCHPQVLITLAARFGRMSWKYDAIAYATTLKHVGVVYQTLYLAATAMGLSASALGSGNSDAFAAAAGTDWQVESSVGEFIIGSMPDREPAEGEASHVA